MIVEPYTLISSTALSQSIFCPRKALLADRFRGGGGTNDAMFLGTVVHEMFQVRTSFSQ